MTKIDTYQRVTDSIIAALEAGTRPWVKRWDDKGAVMPVILPRRATGEYYRGINVLLLWGASEAAGFRSDRWFTFKQAQALGAMVRKGEKGTPIVFFKPLDVKRQDAAGNEVDAKIPMIRTYTVFNADQIEGLPERFIPAMPAPIAPTARSTPAELALLSSGAEVRHGGTRAYYSPGHDFVQMPEFERFEDGGAYLATLAHELCHWTGHKVRLDRSQANKFGSKDYAAEELVAEIGAAFVGARLGIVGEHIENHAAYVASWLKVLKDDKRAIFKAASAAQLAADMVLVNADMPEPDGEPDEAPEAPEAPMPAPAPFELPEAVAPIDEERNAALVAAGAASPLRPAAVDTACTIGLGLFDFVDQPRMI